MWVLIAHQCLLLKAGEPHVANLINCLYIISSFSISHVGKRIMYAVICKLSTLVWNLPYLHKIFLTHFTNFNKMDFLFKAVLTFCKMPAYPTELLMCQKGHTPQVCYSSIIQQAKWLGSFLCPQLTVALENNPAAFSENRWAS